LPSTPFPTFPQGGRSEPFPLKGGNGKGGRWSTGKRLMEFGNIQNENSFIKESYLVILMIIKPGNMLYVKE
jgi:hypothetical protein